MLKVWGEHFNIFVIESVDSHYDKLFDDETDFEEVVDMYSLMLENNIPEEAEIAGFIGFSWGGTLSYRLAERIAQLRNRRSGESGDYRLPNHTHDDLFFDQNQVPYYMQIMLCLLGRDEHTE